MRCPFCGHEESQVKDSRPTDDGAAIRRRRQCEACGERFTTFERVQTRELYVIKAQDRREPFDRSKLERAVSIARRLEQSGESELPSSRIGELVMDGLKALDPVAYIRFASVYKDFREAKDFEAFAGTVSEAGKE